MEYIDTAVLTSVCTYGCNDVIVSFTARTSLKPKAIYFRHFLYIICRLLSHGESFFLYQRAQMRSSSGLCGSAVVLMWFCCYSDVVPPVAAPLPLFDQMKKRVKVSSGIKTRGLTD